MKRMQNSAAFLAVALLLGQPVAWADSVPTFVRSIATSSYRATVTRPDGTALAVAREGVILRDPAGGTRFLTRLKGNQRVAASADARAFGVATYHDNAPSTLRIAKFELYGADGTKRWTVTQPKASEFRVAPQGEYALGIAGGDGMLDAELYLYDHTGAERASWAVNHLSDLTLPARGDRFFAASRGQLLAFPYDGGEPAPLGRFEAFGFSDDGRWVALCGAGKVSVFEGQSLASTMTTELDPIRTVSLSPDGRYVALAGHERLELFDSQSGKLVWTVTSGRPALRFISLALAGAPLRILCGLDLDRGPDVPPAERHRSGAVLLLDEQGELLWREDLSYTSWSARVPRVAFRGGTRQFEVELTEELRHYVLP